MPGKAMRAFAFVLSFLAFLFFLRVLGQVLVAFFDVAGYLYVYSHVLTRREGQG